MSIFIYFLTFLVIYSYCMLSYAYTAPGNSSRKKISLNDNWRFYSGDITGSDIGTAAATEWENITLPHTWNSKDAFLKIHSYSRGIGWYKKELMLSDSLRGRRLYLFFEGANQVTDVFVNGQHIGQHTGGYTAFIFEITGYLNFSQPNIIAVKIDNRYNPDIPPLSADFNFYGGIYRDVWLIETSPVHIDNLNYASPGVFISTPIIHEKSAQININGKIINETSFPQNIKIINKVSDESSNEIFSTESDLTIKAFSFADFEVSNVINNPKLWSPDSPYLYKVFTKVVKNGEPLDEVVNPLGIRWFELRPGLGLYLNGKPIKLYGTNRHQDYPELGNALTDDFHMKDIQIIKENGFNFLRLAHYPQDPAVLQAADEEGVILWEEIPVVNTISMSGSFYKNCVEMLTEMIRQNYNHPSVFIWGYMNEVSLRKPDPMPKGYINSVVKLASLLNSTIKKEDSSRFTAAALFTEEIDSGSGFESIPDIIGMNLYFGWYYDNLKTFGEFLDKFHNKYPKKNLIISEYGAGSDERIHTYEPKAFDFSSEYQQLFHESTFKQIKERDYLIGSALWNHFDFGSNLRQDSKYALNQKGIYFFNREPKDISYYYKAQLNKSPLIYIASREWRMRAGSSKGNFDQTIKVYSNLEKAELYVNDTSLGEKNFNNCTATWNVTLLNGQLLLNMTIVQNFFPKRILTI